VNASTDTGAPIVELSGITKSFPGVLANDHVDVTLRRGEVHCLLGENGAGKSTLIGILSGLIRPDAGTIRIEGAQTVIASPRTALELGIGTVHQHSTLIPERGRDNRAIMPPELLQKTVQGYSDQGTPIGPPGNQQGFFDFPGTGQMFSSARDLVTLMAACIDGNVADPQLREALRMTQREVFHVDKEFGQAMAWENVDLGDLDIVDKPGGLNNASSYLGLVPARKIGLLLLANRGEFSHEIGRYQIPPGIGAAVSEKVVRQGFSGVPLRGRKSHVRSPVYQ